MMYQRFSNFSLCKDHLVVMVKCRNSIQFIQFHAEYLTSLRKLIFSTLNNWLDTFYHPTLEEHEGDNNKATNIFQFYHYSLTILFKSHSDELFYCLRFGQQSVEVPHQRMAIAAVACGQDEYGTVFEVNQRLNHKVNWIVG